MLKNLPETERPRERLAALGPDALSLAELIAIIIGSGTRGKSVLVLAQELIAHFGTLEALLAASIPDLMSIKGLGRAKATQLKAVFAIAARMRAPQSSAVPITAPDDAYALSQALAHERREVLFLICRDVRGNAFHREVISAGILSEVLIHPREVFLAAIRAGAHSLIIAHNHPSGDPEPSRADLDLTKRLLEASHIIGIRLDDHLIIGRDSYVSLWQRGLFSRNQY